jgi:ppGpp synthetase/RelA/SpoT-type nucleotidyltranferase
LPLNQKMITQCVEEYHRSRDRLEKMVRLIVEELERNLSESGIRARVAGRVKSPDSLERKLEKWLANGNKSGLFKSKEDIFEIVGDLAAVRVMTYVERDRERVEQLVKRIFSHRYGKVNFESVKKELEDKRIAQDNSNFYRAIHMQICLTSDMLKMNLYSNLKADHCELQITSMLAHVWNEIEHDIVYKSNGKIVSAEERLALDSLGLLTTTGDNIVASLIQANSRAELASQREAEVISSPKQLSYVLSEFYGSEVSGVKIDYSLNIHSLYQALMALEITHPDDIFRELSPKVVTEAANFCLKEAEEFAKLCDAEELNFAKRSCDIFLIALLSKYCVELCIASRGPKPRHLKIALIYKGCFQKT